MPGTPYFRAVIENQRPNDYHLTHRTHIYITMTALLIRWHGRGVLKRSPAHESLLLNATDDPYLYTENDTPERLATTRNRNIRSQTIIIPPPIN